MSAAFQFPNWVNNNYVNPSPFYNNPYARSYYNGILLKAINLLTEYPDKNAQGLTATELMEWTSKFAQNYYDKLESPSNYLGVDGHAIWSASWYKTVPLAVIDSFDYHGFVIDRVEVANTGTRIRVYSRDPNTLASGDLYPHGLYNMMAQLFTTDTFTVANGWTRKAVGNYSASGTIFENYVWLCKKIDAYTVELYYGDGTTAVATNKADGTYYVTGGSTANSASSNGVPNASYQYKAKNVKLLWRGNLKNVGSVQPQEVTQTINGNSQPVDIPVWQRGFRPITSTVAPMNDSNWSFSVNNPWSAVGETAAIAQAGAIGMPISGTPNPYYNSIKATDANGHVWGMSFTGAVSTGVINTSATASDSVTDYLTVGSTDNMYPGQQIKLSIGTSYNEYFYIANVVNSTQIQLSTSIALTPITQLATNTFTGTVTSDDRTNIYSDILYVSAINGLGTVKVGSKVTGTGIPSNTTILSQLKGTTGGIGLYRISRRVTPIAATTMTQTDSAYDLGYFPKLKCVTGANDTDINMYVGEAADSYDGLVPAEYPGRFSSNYPVALFLTAVPSKYIPRWATQASDEQWEHAYETNTSNVDYSATYDAQHNSNIKQWPREDINGHKLRPSSITWSIDQPTRVVESQNLTRWTRDSGVRRWRFKLTYPPMSREQFLPIFTALHAAHGQARGFRWYINDIAGLLQANNTMGFIPQGYTVDPYIIRDMPVYTTTDVAAGSTYFDLEGFQPSVNNAVNAGDIIKIQHYTDAGAVFYHPYVIINASDSDEFGQVRVRVSHPLMEKIPAHSQCLMNPSHIWVTLNSDTHDIDINTAHRYGFSVEFVTQPQYSKDAQEARGLV